MKASKLLLDAWSLPMRSRLVNVAHGILPPFLFEAALRLAGKSVHPKESYRGLIYHGVWTSHNAKPLHVGRYAELYEKYQPLDPFTPINLTRYRLYNICMMARLCRNVPGDFLFVGISYGVGPRLLYDFLDFGKLDKTLHLLDPFTGIVDRSAKLTLGVYNTDPERVRAQYPPGAPIRIHCGVIPDLLPLPDVTRLAFVSLDTSDLVAESESLPILFEQLSSGGAIVVDRYGGGDGHFEHYDPVFTKLGVEPFWFPSGQAVIVKP